MPIATGLDTSLLIISTPKVSPQIGRTRQLYTWTEIAVYETFSHVKHQMRTAAAHLYSILNSDCKRQWNATERVTARFCRFGTFHICMQAMRGAIIVYCVLL
jgi:hypothetical protein